MVRWLVVAGSRVRSLTESALDTESLNGPSQLLVMELGRSVVDRTASVELVDVSYGLLEHVEA